jgi:hypothetical protein
MDPRRLLVVMAATAAFGAAVVWMVLPVNTRPTRPAVSDARLVVAPAGTAPRIELEPAASDNAFAAAAHDDDAQPAAQRTAPGAFDRAVRLDARGVPIRDVLKPRRARRTRDVREPTETATFLLEADEPQEEAVAGGLNLHHDDGSPAFVSPDDDAMDDEDDDGADPAAVARAALSMVGADPRAEAVWTDAINDPDRDAHERSDLIEDLNEEGFADPHNPTPDDLPLIERRLALIEALAPDALDETNAAAFAEAYNDLLEMHARAAAMQLPPVAPPE